MRHSTPCGVQAHACMLTPFPEARIGSVLPRIVPEIGSVLKEGGQLVQRVVPHAVSNSRAWGASPLHVAAPAGRPQSSLTWGAEPTWASAKKKKKKKSSGSSRGPWPRRCGRQPPPSVRPAFQASWTSLLAPSQRTLKLGFSPKSGSATWLGRGDVPNGQRSRGSLARGPKPSLLTLTQQRPGGAARHSTFASWCERHSATRMAWMIIRGGSGWREERCEGDTPVSIWRAAGTTCMDRVSERCTLWAKFTRCFFEYR